MVKSSCIDRLLQPLAKEKNSVEDLGIGISNIHSVMFVIVIIACVTMTLTVMAFMMTFMNIHHNDNDDNGNNLCDGSGDLRPARCTKDSNHSAFPEIKIPSPL